MTPREMSDSELGAALAEASAACDAAWQAWARARKAGADFHGPEWQGHNRAVAALSPLAAERQRRVNARRIAGAGFAPPPLSGPEWERAWREGPGAEP